MTEMRGPARRMPMFRDCTNTIATIALGVLLGYLGYSFVQWAVVHAVWTLPAGGSSLPCRAVRGEGACWAVVAERARFMIFGSYPLGEQWRAKVVCLLFVSLYAASLVRSLWTRWLFAATVYFGFCYVVSRFSLRLEQELQRAGAR